MLPSSATLAVVVYPPPLFTKLTWHRLFGFILRTKHTVGVKMYLLNE